MLRIMLILPFLCVLKPMIFADQPTNMGWPAPLSNADAWQAMPAAEQGSGSPLPTWARMLAREMPRTAAAFLELDLAQRTKSPVEPGLRAAMRYVAAQANGSKYAQATAAADALASGVSPQKWSSLDTRERSAWSTAEKAALKFAYDMSVDSDAVTDEQFAELVKLFSDRQVAAMVLGMAYANFQDRLLICLGAPLEERPLPPVAVRFSSDALTKQTTPPPAGVKPEVPGTKAQSKDVIQDESPFTWLSYDELQTRLQKQRTRQTRLPIPKWEEFADRLPKGLMEKPSDIVWYKIAFGYADELAVPFEIYMRTAGAEVSSNWDRAFGNSIFWMVTDAVKCPYCMGHCEMNWEVIGMNPDQIAGLSRILAGNDWSSFTEPQQHALAFARKITRTPSKIDRADIDKLRQGFGDQRAFFICLQASRYNYMTRISNGFQLTLESGNPFWDYYRMPAPAASAATQTSAETKDTVPVGVPAGTPVTTSDQPRPTPLTRPEMKQMLEDMKQRKERIPTNPSAEPAKPTAGTTAPVNAGYESRLTEQYLPKIGGARSYLNFSGSPARSANANAARFTQEPDPALTLDYAFKTRLFWIASRVNNCQYCLGHQESKLLATGMSDDQIAALDNDWAQYPANEQAAFALARKLTLEPYRLTDADIDAARQHYSDLQVLEIILSVSGNNAINRWKEGIGTPQSAGGGNFGGSTGDHHSYLTDTNPALIKIKSKIATAETASDQIFVPTKTARTAALSRAALAEGLAKQAQRQPRLPLASEEQTRSAFGELVPAGPVPKWMRLLANFPIAGKRQVTSFVALERNLDLDDATRAALAHVIARQNGAWYSLALIGDGPTKQAPTPKLQALLTVAEHLAASPVVLTDDEVANALKHWSPREVTQAIHYTAMRSLFDRMTEAAGL